jgi:osmotically-inducible protein OsmY
MNRALVLAVFTFAVALSLLAGCVPVLIAGAAGGAAMVATDRRSAGAQVDDESIELKIATQASSEFGERIHLNATSYNGIVLLTGEVPDQAALTSVGNLAKNTEKVRGVHNEMVVGPNSDFSARSNDTYITSKVKTRMLEANKFPPNVVKVVTERSVVYLMGIDSKEEGDAAAEIAATTAGVARVVKFFQYSST